uniref:MT domain-containing protein n=1 Tax=Ascaris lumbricoides TaxID=6252 RepID=A0A0M3ILM2_ASCLU
MNQRDISTLKTMRFPPQGVRLCMEAVCILLGEAPARITDPLGGARVDYWVTGQKVLSDIHFLNRIRNFDKDNVSKETIAVIKNNYLSKDEFDPEVVRQSSVAAEGLCLWVKAIDAYHKIAEVVAPKREKLKKAELLVKRQMKKLETRRKALQGVTERLQSLSDSFSQMSQRKEELLAQIQSCEQRMNRAQRLIGALGGEKVQWDAQLAELEDELIRCPQYTLFAAIAIEYLSALSPKHRQEILNGLRSLLKVEKPFNLQMICDETRHSENAIIIENSRRVPLILQSRGVFMTSGQAKPLLMELTDGRLLVVEASDKRLTAIIRDGISAGSAILVESLVESLPLYIMPFLTLRVFTSAGQQVAVFFHASQTFREAHFG